MNELKYKTPSGINLNYMEWANNGPPLLLVHGNMERWQAFLPVIEDLAQNYHLFALDLRGHGKSSHAGSYVLDTYQQDVADFIQHKISSPVIYFGFSLGGMIGIMAAAQHPKLFSKLIIGDSPLTMATLEPMINTLSEMGAMIINHLKSGNYDALMTLTNDEMFCEALRLCDMEVVESTFYRFRSVLGSFDINKHLPQIQCKTLLLHGDQELGSMLSANDIDTAKTLLPSLTVAKISGAGHGLLMKKDLVLAAIKQFID